LTRTAISVPLAPGVIPESMVMAERDIRISQNLSLGGLWFAGWLFSIGYLKLDFWMGLIGILLWPYFMGSHFAAPAPG
jgi:hypothetical protein